MGVLKIFNEKLNKFFPIILIIFCFILIITRTPFYDEAHAYIISQFSFVELWQITRLEGHPLFWFLVLKPISFLNLYPYPMLFLTWIVSSVLIIFFWKKSPFSFLFKTLVLLSFPFLGYFLIAARPYGLTVLFLFLTAYYFKKEKLFPFAFALAFLSNTTIMGAIGAIGFLGIFIKKLIVQKINKKDAVLSFVIILLAFVFLFFQLSNSQIPNKIFEYSEMLKNNLIYYFVFPLKDFASKTILQNVFQTFSFILFYSSLVIFFKKEKNSFIFLVSSFLLLTLLFLKIYSGATWHYFFYFVFFIVALWISWDEIKTIKIYNYFIILFLIMMITPFSYLDKKELDVFNQTKKYFPILNRIITDESLKDSKLFCFEKTSYIAPALVPYLKKYGVELYDINGYKRDSFESYINLQKNNSLDEFVSKLDKKRNNYLFVNNLSNTNIPPIIILEGKNYKITLKMIDKIDESIFAIYKIEAKKN